MNVFSKTHAKCLKGQLQLSHLDISSVYMCQNFTCYSMWMSNFCVVLKFLDKNKSIEMQISASGFATSHRAVIVNQPKDLHLHQLKFWWGWAQGPEKNQKSRFYSHKCLWWQTKKCMIIPPHITIMMRKLIWHEADFYILQYKSKYG